MLCLINRIVNSCFAVNILRTLIDYRQVRHAEEIGLTAREQYRAERQTLRDCATAHCNNMMLYV